MIRCDRLEYRARAAGSEGMGHLAIAAVIGMTAAAHAGDPAETAEYEVVFDAAWSPTSHPEDYPGGAHFSPLIGGTHVGAIAFWREGELASTGIERMAETGSKTILRNEVQAAIDAGHAFSVIEGSQVIGGTGMTSTTFAIAQDFPRATVVSMIAPSPDWFVGTQGLPLFVDGHWVPEVVFELLPYDAGTDSGVSYTSSDEDTQPPDPIAEILGYPFADEGARAQPLGTFAFRRLNAPPCPGDVDASGHVAFADVLAILAIWGPCEACPEDIDGDGDVGFADVLRVLGDWGPCG